MGWRIKSQKPNLWPRGGRAGGAQGLQVPKESYLKPYSPTVLTPLGHSAGPGACRAGHCSLSLSFESFGAHPRTGGDTLRDPRGPGPQPSPPRGRHLSRSQRTRADLPHRAPRSLRFNNHKHGDRVWWRDPRSRVTIRALRRLRVPLTLPLPAVLPSRPAAGLPRCPLRGAGSPHSGGPSPGAWP
ncbi:hypothetical protein HJG60_008818 [Phyllostomus discolor]|uniref:Uncharacterized protein n=1 Tax=Phyllostomus discolor TaxID=89673 RepID=A0A834DL52_9CHIR|nr:hypothetical protein HJG60_008818 [Phyllostomus discolor]